MVNHTQSITRWLDFFDKGCAPKFSKSFRLKKTSTEIFVWLATLILLWWFACELHSLTQKKTIEHYLNENPPSILLWKTVLEKHQFLAIQDINRIHKLQKSLPLQNLDPHTFWVDQTFQWIVITEGTFGKTHYFQRNSEAKLPSAFLWSRRLNHWQELDDLTKTLSGLPKPEKKQTINRKTKDHFQFSY